ncbi:DUF4265 domain-containing protein, partial [Streptomyces sp. NPDC059349]|uniref:DUF4265 domain-containing protein n=1 Tax=Streptomyces sp. NPDC059349 TaxID=3346808 RepID=UPI003699ECD3
MSEVLTALIANLSDRQDGWREQLWTRQITDDRFEVACLPFFTYGICYRDVVTIDSNHLVASVVQKSGHRTLRVAFVAEHQGRDQLHELLHSKVLETALSHEWLQRALARNLGFTPGRNRILWWGGGGGPRPPGAAAHPQTRRPGPRG